MAGELEQPAQALSLLNSDFAGEQATKLASSVDADNIDNAELIRRVIPAVLSRGATESEIADGVDLINRLENQHQLTNAQAKRLYCLSVLNWNEFLFVD